MDVEALRMQFVLAHNDELQGIFEIALAEVERLKDENEELTSALSVRNDEVTGLSGMRQEIADKNNKLREALEWIANYSSLPSQQVAKEALRDSK